MVGNNPLYTERELSHQLNDCGAEVVVVLDSLYPKLEGHRDESSSARSSSPSVTDYMPFPMNMLRPDQAEEGGASTRDTLAAGSEGRAGQVVEKR